MANGVNGGRWQLAFWIITGFFVLTTTVMGQAVITNDRMRVVEDQAILEKLYTVRKDTNDKFTVILCEISSIKTLISKNAVKQ